MRSMILAAALSLSASAFAQVCEVDMVDNRSNRVITTFRTYDYNDSCKEGMKQCRLEIRQRNLLGRADCVRATDSYPSPNPYPAPNPYPNPRPVPRPDNGSYEARRSIHQGERVVYNNNFVTVIGSNFNGQYSVRTLDVWNSVYNNIRRESLSVTSGCSRRVCVSETVINTSLRSFVTVVGLSYDERFVTQSMDVWNTISSNVDRRNLAVTTGCVMSRYAQICVGDTVLNRFNNYSKVVGIQEDGRVVLQSTDVWNTLSVDIDPSNLVITR